MLVQLSDPLLSPLLGSWRLDPLSMQIARKLIPAAQARASVDAAMAYAQDNGKAETLQRFLNRCQDDKVVIAPRHITFHHFGKPPFRLPIQKVSKEGRKTLIHCIQKPPYKVGPVTYSFHFRKDRLVMSEQTGWRKAITHHFYIDR